jgi:hypothetical protein
VLLNAIADLGKSLGASPPQVLAQEPPDVVVECQALRSRANDRQRRKAVERAADSRSAGHRSEEILVELTDDGADLEQFLELRILHFGEQGLDERVHRHPPLRGGREMAYTEARDQVGGQRKGKREAPHGFQDLCLEGSLFDPSPDQVSLRVLRSQASKLHGPNLERPAFVPGMSRRHRIPAGDHDRHVRREGAQHLLEETRRRRARFNAIEKCDRPLLLPSSRDFLHARSAEATERDSGSNVHQREIEGHGAPAFSLCCTLVRGQQSRLPYAAGPGDVQKRARPGSFEPRAEEVELFTSANEEPLLFFIEELANRGRRDRRVIGFWTHGRLAWDYNESKPKGTNPLVEAPAL